MINQFDESEFFRMLKGRLDERTSRLVAAAAAKAGARGSLAKVIKACGLSGVTVWRGYSETNFTPRDFALLCSDRSHAANSS